MVIRILTAGDFEIVHAAFLDAFSDYVVPLAPSREQLLEMLTRRAWLPEASVGMFDDERLVAFTLNGIDGNSGYDSGTGVVPSHRRHGLARTMMERSFELLRERGCTRYVLEVIDSNTRAADLYRGLGFVESRGLQCWTFASDSDAVTFDGPGSTMIAGDIEPPWQNTPASISRAREPHVTFGDDRAMAILFPGNGDLPHLAVRRDARRQGLGTRLLHAAAHRAGKPLRIMNVDERDQGIARFLEAAGARKMVRQLEMIRPL